MNTCRHLLLLALLGLITACSLNELPENLSPLPIEEDGLVLQVETRAETYKGQSLDQEYFVTAEDLENFVKYRRSASKRSDLTVREVKSYGFDTSQTLFYILNYDQGWEVVSADKRIQPTLAHGDSGEFTMECDNDAMKFWMNMLADGVLQMRLGNIAEDKNADSTERSADEKGVTFQDNVAFWNAISPSAEATKGGGINIPTPGPLLPGDTTLLPTHKYYLPHLSETWTESTYYGPYIQTQWGQGYPWNECCPNIDSVSVQAKVGCAAVATGQMLYYLQDKYNLIIYTPESIICSSDLSKNPPKVDWIPFFPNYELWDDMATYYFERDEIEHSDGNVSYVAALLSYLGKFLNMMYEVEGSYIQNHMVVSDCLEVQYNIDCLNNNIGIGYSVSTIKNQLKNEALPVIIYTYFNQDNNIGHMWIIDGCYTFRHVIRNYYVLSTSLMDSFELGTITKEEATGYEDTIHSGDGDTFHMNWGEGGDYDGWYAQSTNSWNPTSSSSFVPSQAKIIYDFSPIH